MLLSTEKVHRDANIYPLGQAGCYTQIMGGQGDRGRCWGTVLCCVTCKWKGLGQAGLLNSFFAV